MIQLKEIDKTNYKVCAKLKLVEGQEKFVAPNWYSLLEANYEGNRRAFGIYSDEEMIGFVMFSYYDADKDYPVDSWWIERLMIAKEHQNKGYGKVGIEKAIEWFRASNTGDELRISAVKSNQIAIDLYQKLGFELTGEEIDGEVVLWMKIR